MRAVVAVLCPSSPTPPTAFSSDWRSRRGRRLSAAISDGPCSGTVCEWSDGTLVTEKGKWERTYLRWQQTRKDEIHHVWKRGPKEGSVNTPMPCRFGRINVFASTAVQFDRFLVGDVCEPYGQEWVLVTEHTGASTEICALEFLELRAWSR